MSIGPLEILILLPLLALLAAVVWHARIRSGRGRRSRDALSPIDEYLAVLEQQRLESSVAVNRIVTACKLIEEPLRQKREEARVWEGRAREALSGGNEEGAREHLRRQIDAERQVSRLEADLQALSGTRTRVEEQYAAIRSRLEEARRERELLLARGAAAAVGLQALEWQQQAERAREAFAELRAQTQSVEAQAEASAEIAAMGRRDPAPANDELERRLLTLKSGGGR
jgi:phage shock protein A